MYDVIIVGARCAGASLACFLGRQGHQVLLLDKYAAPGPTLSTHLIGETDLYDRLGIRERMENAGAPAITRMRVDWDGHLFESDLAVTPRVLGLRRELLDRFLLDAALAEPSVTFRPRTKAVGVLTEGGRATGVRCREADGGEAVYTAKAIVGADGMASFVAAAVHAPVQAHAAANHPAVCYAYYAGVEPLPLPAVEWYWGRERIVLCNPIDGGLHCLALMLPVDTFAGWRGADLAAAMAGEFRRLRMLEPRLRHMRPAAGSPKGAARLESFLKQPYGEGWALVGDAGAFLHPAAGVGIDNAVASAEHLADALHAYLTDGAPWAEALAQYAALRDERIRPQFDLLQVTLSRTAAELTEPQRGALGMLCTFPGLVKELGGRSEDVLALLSRRPGEQ